jgi:preprotein translocase subunit YajC
VRNRLLLLVLGSSIASLPVPVLAQTSASANADIAAWVGKSVVDTKEQPVGIVASMKGGMLFIKTDKHEVPLPPASFALQNGKLYFALSREQLNADYEKAVAASEAALTVGAAVKGTQGKTIGTIEAMDSEFATIKLESGQSIRIPRNGIAGTPDGAVLGVSAEQLATQVNGDNSD